MLEQILDFIHNYFIVGVITGDFSVVDGALTVEGLQEGQYYKIEGSVFNDGVHQYPSTDLTDEQFSGRIGAMAVPPMLIALCAEIEAWQNKYGAQALSPYQSESFGGYSYSKGSGAKADGSAVLLGWQDVFGRRLNKWRKLI